MKLAFGVLLLFAVSAGLGQEDEAERNDEISDESKRLAADDDSGGDDAESRLDDLIPAEGRQPDEELFEPHVPHEPNHDDDDQFVASPKCADRKLLPKLTGVLDKLARSIRDPDHLFYFRKAVERVLQRAATLDDADLELALDTNSGLSVLELGVLLSDDVAVSRIASSAQDLSGDFVEEIARFVRNRLRL